MNYQYIFNILSSIQFSVKYIKEFYIMSTIKIFLDQLMSKLSCDTQSELSSVLGVPQNTLSYWKTNNSIRAVKKRLTELGRPDLLDMLNQIKSDKIISTASETITENQYVIQIKNLVEKTEQLRVSLDFSPIDNILKLLKNRLHMKIIFQNIEEIYSETGLAGSSLRDGPVYEIAEDSDGVKYGKKALIDYILQTVKNTDIEYFKSSDTFPFIFKVNEKMMDIVSSYIDFGDGVYIEDYEDVNDYNKACEKYKFNPTDAVIAAEKIIHSIKSSFSFNDENTVWFLKNNIDNVIKIWEHWLDCERKCYIDYYESMEYDAMVENNPDQNIPPYKEFKDPRKSDEFYDLT